VHFFLADHAELSPRYLPRFHHCGEEVSMPDREFQKRWKKLAGRISREHELSKRNELTWELIKLLEIKKSGPEDTHSHKTSA
jgi:hypothetical protein